jgi:hypothetical protein
MVTKKYGLFRGDLLVGRELYKDITNANKEKERWNKEFEDFNKQSPNKKIQNVEVREYKIKKMSSLNKLKNILG